MPPEIQSGLRAEIDDPKISGVSVWGTMEDYEAVVRTVRDCEHALRVRLDTAKHASTSLDSWEFRKTRDGPVEIHVKGSTLRCEGSPAAMGKLMNALESVRNSVVIDSDRLDLIDRTRRLLEEGIAETKAELEDVLETSRSRVNDDPPRSGLLPHVHIEYWGDGHPDYLHPDCIPLIAYRIPE